MSWIVNSKLIKFQRTLYTIFLFEKSAIYLLCQNHIQHQDVSTHNHLQETSIPNFTTTRTSFFLEFQPFFLEFVIITIWRTIFPKFTTFVFPIDFLVCHFFSSTQPALPSLVVCGCFCQEELQRGEGGRGKYTRHLSFVYFYFLEKPMGKHSEKKSGDWTRFVFCFFSKHIFHFWKNNGKHFVFPPNAYISSRKCGLKGLISPPLSSLFQWRVAWPEMKTCSFARLWWHAQLIQKRADLGGRIWLRSVPENCSKTIHFLNG